MPTHALYLRSEGNANSRKGDGRADAMQPEGREPRDVFVYDPEVPVLAPGGPQALSGPFDQAALEMGNNLLVYTSEPVRARDGDLRAAARSAVCGDVGGACGFYGKACACDGERPRGVSLDRHCAQFMAVSRCRLCGGRGACVGVHAGADCVCAGCRRAAAAGDCEFRVSALRSQSIDGGSAAACGQLELGAIDAAGAAFGRASLPRSICR